MKDNLGYIKENNEVAVMQNKYVLLTSRTVYRKDLKGEKKTSGNEKLILWNTLYEGGIYNRIKRFCS